MNRIWTVSPAITLVIAACCVPVAAQEEVLLHSVTIQDENVVVQYSKNFDTCAHLYRYDDVVKYPGAITHFANLFCESGEDVVVTQPTSMFRLLQVGQTVYLRHGNNAGIYSDSVTVTNPPIADAGHDFSTPCVDGAGLAQLDGSRSSDPNGDALSFHWIGPDGVAFSDANSANPIAMVPFGVTMLTLTVTDEHGATAIDDVVVTVVDDAPPEVACTTNVATLRPANRKMVAVQVIITATDDCSPAGLLDLISVTLTSDEPDDAPGRSDGSTSGDTNGL